MVPTMAGQPVVERDYHINVENSAVAKYIAEVIYEPGNPSVVTSYTEGTTGRLDIPTPVVMELPESDVDSLWIVCCDEKTLGDSLTFHVPAAAGVAQLYNFIPQRTYLYEVKAGDVVKQQGRIFTDGQVRMIRVPGTVANVRDLGGWTTEDGQRIKYGRIFRGSALNGTYYEATEEGIEVLRELGVGAEIDMRAWYNEGNNVSVFGFQSSANTPSGQVPTFYYSSDSGQLPAHLNTYSYQYRWRMEFQFIVNNLRQQRAIYQHCVLGRDRTGYLSLLLEGVLGLSYNDLIKEYELSFFDIKSASKKDSIDKVIDYIEQLDGETLRDKFNTYFVKKLLVKQTDIDYFRAEMLEAATIDDDDNGDNNDDDGHGPLTGVAELSSDKVASISVSDISGRRVMSTGRGGIFLLRDSNGRVRKMIGK